MTRALRWIPICGALLTIAPAPAMAADAFKTECKNVARTTGLFSSIIRQSCEGYPQHRSACAPHISRKGVPNLVRADNFMECLCEASRVALETDAQDLCHASSAIHGLLDDKMRAIQVAARDLDKKREVTAASQEKVERMQALERDAEKSVNSATNQRDQVKAKATAQIAKNAKLAARARAVFDATLKKLRAAETAARKKLEALEAKIAAEDAAARDDLEAKNQELARALEKSKEIGAALQARERQLASAESSEQKALTHEQSAVRAHLESMNSPRTGLKAP